MLYDIAAGRWDPELLELFEVPRRALPEVRPSAGPFGVTLPEALFGHAAPIAGVAGDQQAALFGQGCVDPGMGKNTYGTGSFVLLNAGPRVPAPASGLLSTVAWGIGARMVQAPAGLPSVRGLPGSPPRGSCRLLTLRPGGLDFRHRRGRAVAARRTWDHCRRRRVRGARGLAAVQRAGLLRARSHWPRLAALGPPRAGDITGLTRGSTRAHFARAALEAIAYQTVDAVRAMEAGAGIELHELRADGGATVNRWLMQFQADILGMPVLVPEVAETTALGAALLAGVGAGLWTLADVRDGWRVRARYEPRMGEDERAACLQGGMGRWSAREW